MNILAIDCCLRLTGTALMMNGEVIGSVQEDLGRKQSRELPLMVNELLGRANLSVNDIDYVALTNGPGYFTGVRVGAAYASGLAYAVKAKIIPVSSLELLSASSGSTEKKILAVVYAGHGFVYAYSNGFLEAGEYSHDDIREWLKSNTDALIISDDPERIKMNDIDMLRVRPDVKTLCEIAYSRHDSAINPLELKVSYYRAPQGLN